MEAGKLISGLIKSNRRCLLIFFIYLLNTTASQSQTCPPNIDFETGTFNGWTCYTGFTASVENNNVISLASSSGPVFDKHTMYSAPSAEVDYYGKFPVICPNGSGHSIKLGNARGGGEAEGISYEFTIPANDNSFSLIYHYAVVFQAPNHRESEQPRMEIEIMDVKENRLIDCASFTFIALGTSLPGFQVSSTTDTTTVLYKDWSAVTVDLSGNAGKTIRLMFKTADCTFRRHFGYAYIDVNSECTNSFEGSSYCPDDTLVNVTAPYGYQGYTWYDSSLANVLGNNQKLSLPINFTSGKTLAVRLTPFNGYGCTKTFFTKLTNDLKVTADAGRDTLSCNLNRVPIGTRPMQGLVYEWTPSIGLNNYEIANPFASPQKNTTYIVTTGSLGGGCRTNDTVLVKASLIDTLLVLLGKTDYCLDYGDSSVFIVKPTLSIQWFKNGNPLVGAQQTRYSANSSGTYYADLKNAEGCIISTKKQPIVIEKEQPGITYPIQYAIVNEPITLDARPIGEKVLWDPKTYLDNAISFTPVFTGGQDKNYTIEITTKAGCITVDTQFVKTIKNVELIVPTAFTPNQDGKNDYLRPVLRGVRTVNYFKIFNRWGVLIFETKNPLPGWDGNYKGVFQTTQTIVWMLQCIGLDGREYNAKGTTVLIR